MQKAQDEPKTIVALKRKTFTRLISLWEKFLLTDKTIEDTWSSVTSTCVDSSTIYNAVGNEWLTVMNEEGDVINDIDLEKLKPEEMVEITFNKKKMKKAKETYYEMDSHSAVYTFSCFVEGDRNHKVEANATAARGENKALTSENLIKLKGIFDGLGAKTVLYNLKKLPDEPDAKVLHIPNSDDTFASETFMEIKQLGLCGIDTKVFNARKKCVQNKLARGNFNIGDKHQDPDIANGINTLYSFSEMPNANKIRQVFNGMAEKANIPSMRDLWAEANVYYHDKCGIRYHGDTERPNSPVIGVNFGKTRYLDFRSFYKHRFHGEQIRITLNHGDIYIMNEHAVGVGWLKYGKSRVLFRHRAGSAKFMKIVDREIERKYRISDAKQQAKQEKKKEKEMEKKAQKQAKLKKRQLQKQQVEPVAKKPKILPLTTENLLTHDLSYVKFVSPKIPERV